MKRIPVIFQLVVILAIVLIIPTSIVTYYTSSRMIKHSTEEIATTALQQTKSSKELNEVIINNMIYDMLQIADSNNIKKFSNIKSYKELNSNYENVNAALNLLKSLEDIASNNAIIYSMNFYLDSADYIISSNKGIVTLENYESLEWLDTALKRVTGAEGIWYPRVVNTATVMEQNKGILVGREEKVITYVYQLSRLTTATRGTIIINLYESQIANLLNSNTGTVDYSSFLLDEKDQMISNQDKSLLGTIISQQHKEKITDLSGFYFMEEENQKYLYTYDRGSDYKWTYMSKYSMDSLLEKTYELRRNSIIVMSLIIIVGIVFTILFASYFSKPMRSLVKQLTVNKGLQLKKNQNELEFISNAFNEIQIQEEELHRVLKVRENETRKMALHAVLTGDELSEIAKQELNSVFQYEHYIVSFIAVDNSMKFMSTTTHELRTYQRYQMNELMENAFPEGYYIQSARYSSTVIACIINVKTYDSIRVNQVVREVFTTVLKKAEEIMGTTVTIGISTVHSGMESIIDCTYEANQAVKRRLIEGGNSITFWNTEQKENYKYHYFYNSEKKIINYLDTKDKENLKKEMNCLVDQIKAEENISNDNILLIFYQLVGSIIKYLADHNMNTSKVLGIKANIYSIIANLDTLEEIKEYLLESFFSIIDYMSEEENPNETRYCEQILLYLKEHYKEDIIFEELAAKMGISYSYLRRLVKEETGKSVLDNVNSMRIEEVKRLLLYTDMNIIQIAEEVGYHNTQSMNRFFKKFEGISPSEFKLVKQE